MGRGGTEILLSLGLKAAKAKVLLSAEPTYLPEENLICSLTSAAYWDFIIHAKAVNYFKSNLCLLVRVAGEPFVLQSSTWPGILRHCEDLFTS
ncbi:hypothetical protein scyTo_0002367 [Scyliorhinus torazame]|uniref:Uncharacterized protein n=1 Tax=Scyliorhinus torazame TaxID=75743 RepID=A0A401PJ32_SCYTO|nr:hypothetical protein [Scyliorhinus torazame]